MTPQELEAFGQDIDALYEKHAAVLGGDYAMDAVMLGLAMLVEHEKNQQVNELVISCLNSAHEHLSMAALDYYVSTK